MAINAINSLHFGENDYVFTLPYGECSTAAGTAAKTATVENFSLETGIRVLIKFTVTNTVANPTLDINGTGAKAIFYRGAAINKSYLAAKHVYEFVYDGTNWELIGDIDTDTSISVGNKSSTDTIDLVYAVTNLVESGTKNHTITPTYTGLPTKTYVDKIATGHVKYLGTVAALTGLSMTAGQGDFYRVSAAFTFGSETAHVGDIILATKGNPAQNATDWDLIHAEIDSNSWVANTASAAGYVSKGSGNANKVWKTDGSGNPAWRDDANTTYTFNGAVSTIKDNNLTAGRALISSSSGKVAISDTTSTELGYVHGVTSAIQTQLNSKIPNSGDYTNKYLSWNSSSHLQNVILLIPVLQSNNWSGFNYIDGRFFLWKTGGNVYDVINVNANCVYNQLRYHLEMFGDHPTATLCVCKYNNILYYAIKCPYHANPYTHVTFTGRIKSELSGGTTTVDLPLQVPYYDENSKTVLNAEVKNSITDTLTTTYVTSASGTPLYCINGFTGNLNGNAATATKLVTARTISVSDTAGTTGTSFNGTANISLVIPTNLTNFNRLTFSTSDNTFSPAAQSIVLNGVGGSADNAKAPGIGFHIGNKNWASLKFLPDGTFRFYNNDGTGYQPVYASAFYGALKGNADTATKATKDGDGYTISTEYIKKLGDRIYYQSVAGALRLNDGTDNRANGKYSIAAGYYTKTESIGELAIGSCNEALGADAGTSLRSIFIAGGGYVNSSGSIVKSNLAFLTTLGHFLIKGDYTSTGGDYAEYFEWEDGNMNQEDRRGYSVNVQPAASQPAAPDEKKMTAIERKSKLQD